MNDTLKGIEELGKYLGDIKGMLEYEKTGIARVNIDTVINVLLTKLQEIHIMASEEAARVNEEKE